MAPLLAALALLLAAVPAASAPERVDADLLDGAAPAALAADDECRALGEEGCALEALQLRAARGAADQQAAAALAGHPSQHQGKPSQQHQGHDSHDPQLQTAAAVPSADPSWCLRSSPPRVFAADSSGPGVPVKVLSYNLFWWNLYRANAGRNDSAAKLILAHNTPAFDVMGFQECENITRVLQPVGLMDQFEGIMGPYATCMAYNKQTWQVLAKGSTDVAEDMPTRFYGKRTTQWLRLSHRATLKTLFFINHHGPLSVNSGGVCGGQSTAYNLLNVAVTFGKPGDAVVLVGDFNANAAGLTIQSLWRNLVHIYVGKSWGGVDNIFSNVDTTNVIETKILGPGGSDHDAISATIQIGGGAPASVSTRGLAVNMPMLGATELTASATKPGYDWQYYWCGLVEQSVQYAHAPGAWSNHSDLGSKGGPDSCCRECQQVDRCASWVWQVNSCTMYDRKPTAKVSNAHFVSGLAFNTAAAAAAEAASAATAHVA